MYILQDDARFIEYHTVFIIFVSLFSGQKRITLSDTLRSPSSKKFGTILKVRLFRRFYVFRSNTKKSRGHHRTYVLGRMSNKSEFYRFILRAAGAF